MADQYVKRIANIVTGMGSGTQPSYQIYPAMTGVPAVGVTFLTAAGAWGLMVDLVAAAAITADFWVCGFQFDTTTANTIFEILLSKTGPAAGLAGPPTAPYLFAGRTNTTAATLNLPPYMLPIPVYCVGSSRICGYAGTTAAKSINISMLYVTGW